MRRGVVGVAPGTTTLVIPNGVNGAIPQDQYRVYMESQAREFFGNPGFGVITNPPEVSTSRGSGGHYEVADDDDAIDQWTGASVRRYFDSNMNGLRGIPTDFDLAKTRNYLPVESGWIQTLGETAPATPSEAKWPLIIAAVSATALVVSTIVNIISCVRR